ncbi:MAG: histidine phosphatase family protein [Candidatus Methylomirabilia bacterium]
MTLLLARHGQSVWNAARRFQGSIDVGLSELGRSQALALGRALRGRRLATAYVSPLRRAVETAEIAVEGLGVPLSVLDDLRELSLGAWEGRTVEEVRAGDGDPYLQWLLAPLDCPPPASERLAEVATRVLAVVEQIVANHPDGGEVLVVSHGGVISTYLCHLLGLSLNRLWRLRVDNASLTVVRPPRLITLNETAHLAHASPSAGFARAADGGRFGRGA